MRGSRARSGLKAITDPALYKRAEELFSQAVELTSEEQLPFLQEQCGSNTDLLRLVQDLLREDRSGSILREMDAGAVAAIPANQDDLSGRTLSHYHIIGPMAAGGMGILYRATETRLQRTVALKFLPPLLTNNVTSRERFVREARAIASIDHQNVCPVYEIDEADGHIFIAMACLEGVTLDEKMEKGPLPAEYAVDIALQTARGLQAAHAKGIVHRDIKPANLMLIDTEPSEALVRILDFGIAQWTGKTVLTEEGLTIGTVSYMAPEQIAGSHVDRRADIWSLGVVLYQMLSGRLPFDGQSVREILAAIAGPKPVNLAPLRKVVAPELISVLQKALEKDPARRYGTASALVSDLEALSGGGVPLARRTHKWLWAAGILALAGAVGVAVFTVARREVSSETDISRIVPFTFYPGYQQHPAISPDGREIAFVGQGKDGTDPLEVYVQLIGSTDPLRLTKVSAGSEDRSPAWDPNATRIAFLRTRDSERFARILTVPALGGSETDLGVEGVLGAGRIAWSPNGNTLAFTGSQHSEQGAIFELSLSDRTIRQRSFPADGQSDCCPQYDSSGKRLAFKRNEVEIVVTGADHEPMRALPARASWPGLTWTADGRSLVYSWFGKLAKVDIANGATTWPAAALGSDICDISIRGKRMTYVRWSFEHSIWELKMRRPERGLKPKIAAVANDHLIASTMREDTPQFSPDGEWIAFASERLGSANIWVGKHDGSGLRRLTFLDGQSAGTPRWSPDGKWITFDLRPPSSKPDVWFISVAGGDPRRLANVPGGADVPSWSQDGRWIYYHSRSDDQIWKRPWEGGPPIQVTRGGGFEAFESVNGKYLYYSKGGDIPGIWRLDLANGNEAPIPELSEAGVFRHWALAPRGIYFVPNGEAFRKDAAVRFFDFATRKTVRVGTVGKLVTAGPGALAVSRDETSLLYVHVDRDNRNIMLVENFK
ncbi:MAG: serine/threonine-protein kinase [Acidobacteriaceae bacterium]|nr:serine/threonine-protein kinase [Acidobacteriaceae bacterium]